MRHLCVALLLFLAAFTAFTAAHRRQPLDRRERRELREERRDDGPVNKHPTYVLPLASPLGDPKVTYIPPWSFGNSQWDPLNGMAQDSGPSPDYHHALVPAGQTAPFPPGTIPEANPVMYIQRPAFLQLSERIRVHQDPTYVLPLAGPMGDPKVTYIPPWSYGNRRLDPIDGMPEDNGPAADLHHANEPTGSTSPFPPGTVPEANPNVFIQRPPTGANSGINPGTMARFQDTRLNAAGTSVGDSMQKQLKFNEFPNEFPFFTNKWYQDENGGLPLLANYPEPESRKPAFMETAAVVREVGADAEACRNCVYYNS